MNLSIQQVVRILETPLGEHYGRYDDDPIVVAERRGIYEAYKKARWTPIWYTREQLLALPLWAKAAAGQPDLDGKWLVPPSDETAVRVRAEWLDNAIKDGRLPQ